MWGGNSTVRLICLADTHGLHRKVKVPDGDLLIHAGDFTSTGDLAEIEDFSDWLEELPHKHKVVIASNHELAFEDPDDRSRALVCLKNRIYLEENELTVEGLRVWGSPRQPAFNN